MIDSIEKRKKQLFLIAVVALIVPLFVVEAQNDGVEIAKTYTVSESVSVEFGDILSFDSVTQSLNLSQTRGDQNIFGIAVENPLLVVTTENGGIPVVRSGEVLVNVSNNGGEIAPGDLITSSAIPGKGQKANESDEYIIGMALESFPNEDINDGESVFVGTINVLLSIGTRQNALAELEITPPQASGVSEASLLNVIQYLLAAFIAVGSVYIAFKNFAPGMREGITSIGRNPLAKPSIQSMIILHSVIIVLISGGGLLVAIAILLLPI